MAEPDFCSRKEHLDRQLFYIFSWWNAWSKVLGELVKQWQPRHGSQTPDLGPDQPQSQAHGPQKC